VIQLIIIYTGILNVTNFFNYIDVHDQKKENAFVVP